MGLEGNGFKKKGKRALRKKRIGVLMGGFSSEREISLRSGKSVLSSLLELGYKAAPIDCAGDDMAGRLMKERIDVAFIALHGHYGENGAVQGLMEMMGIPYTGSGVLSSALAMDKAASKAFLSYHGIPTPEFMVLKNNEMPRPTLPMPFIVKPSSQGSTIGVSIVDKKDRYHAALRKAYRYDTKVLVERFVDGRELTVAILDGRVFPVLEIIAKGAIFNFRAKYTKGGYGVRVPAELKKGLESRIKSVALSTYNLIGCSGAARVDMILEDKTEEPYVLEINTVPGMTEVSLFPRAAASEGIGYPALVELMLLGAGLKTH